MICSKADLKIIRQRNQGKIIVQTSGVFDLVHPGHISYLKKCKELGDILVVLVPSDEFVRQRKGANRPLQDQSSRAIIVDALKPVDYVVCTNKNYSADNTPTGIFIGERIGTNIIVDISMNYWQKHLKSLAALDIDLKILKHSGPIHTSDLIKKARIGLNKN